MASSQNDISASLAAVELDAGKDPPKGFLALPPEIREQIYELLIVKPQNTITMLSNHYCHQSEISACQPALSFVNHQLRDETLPIFYSNNLFLAEVSDKQDMATAVRWLERIGDKNVSCLCRLALCGWSRVPFGHMVSKRWLKVVVDLKAGTMKVESTTDHPSVEDGIEDFKEAFVRLVQGRDGKRFDVANVASVVNEFRALCTYY